MSVETLDSVAVPGAKEVVVRVCTGVDDPTKVAYPIAQAIDGTAVEALPVTTLIVSTWKSNENQTAGGG